MTAYLLDTNHVSALFKRDSGIISRVERATEAEFGIGLPSVGELWFMVYNSQRIAANAAELDRILADFRLWGYERAEAVEFGRIKAELRRTGRPIPDIDVQLAGIARINGLTLLTSDKHFEAVSDLKIENWLVS